MFDYIQVGIPTNLQGIVTVAGSTATSHITSGTVREEVTANDGSIGAKAGARHSKGDSEAIQSIHDMAVLLGAECEEDEPEEDGIKIKPMEKAMSFDEMAEKIRMAWYKQAQQSGSGIMVWRDLYGVSFGVEDNGIWICAIYPDRLIVRVHGIDRCFAYDYVVDAAGGVTFGTPYEVKQEWVNVATEQSLTETESEGNELKAIKEDDNELRVGNHIILFGSEDARDLEGIGTRRINKDGTRGEFFTAKTVLDSPYTENNLVAEDWEHGEDPDQDHPDPNVKSPGRDDILGYVDWSTAKATKRGVWVERVLNKRNKYVQWLKQLIADGLIGTSSEPVQKGVKKAANGEILEWPLYRDTLTIKPMEWRMMSENTLQAIKALALADVQAAKALVENLEQQEQNQANDGKVAGAIRQQVTIAKARLNKNLLDL